MVITTNPDTIYCGAGTLNPTTNTIMAKSTLPIPQLSASDKERFFSKVSTTPTDAGCTEWTAASRAGYGAFRIARRQLGAHRVAYLISTGVDPRELSVCHSCDNPLCVNPSHLSLGTPQDNSTQMAIAGRAAKGDKNGARLYPERLARGEGNGNSKLTESQVITIRADTRVQREIALDYGVRRTLISSIKLRKIWKHVA